MSSSIVVGPGDASVRTVELAWSEVLLEMSTPESAAQSAAHGLGIDPVSLTQAKVEVSQREGDLGVTFLVILGAPVAKHALVSLWDDLVRPRLRAKFGVDGGPHVD